MNRNPTRNRTDDEGFETLLRRADPLPADDELAAETARAMERSRTAVAQAAGGRRAVAPTGIAAAFTTYPAPWGLLHLAAGPEGIVAIELACETADFVDALARRLHGRVVPIEDEVPEAWRAHLDEATRQLAEYFDGRRRAFELPVDLRGVSEWDRRVLAGAASLDFGEVTSYGALARRIGKPGAARAVGGALGRNPIPIVIPCHRILAADGTIGGYGGGGHGARESMLSVKRRLLGIEGAWPAA